MIIALSGSRGFIGSALVRHLVQAGHQVIRLVRGPPKQGEVPWSPEQTLPLPDLEEVDALIHLAGVGIADQRWSKARKVEIYRSRVEATRHLLAGVRALRTPPRSILCASATGVYGDRGDAWAEETDPPGKGFLAGVCRDWERAARDEAPTNSRVVGLRFGPVLDRSGGMLRRLLPIFRLGLGGPLGGGRFYLPWIDRNDACEAIRFLTEQDSLEGPFNITAPAPVMQREFAHALGRALHRPAVLPVPGPILRVLYGDMATEVLLQGVRARPAQLVEHGFRFHAPTIDDCLRRHVGVDPKGACKPSPYIA